MSESQIVRPLDESEWDALIAITAHAYPGMKVHSEEDRAHYRERIAQNASDPALHYYGLFRGGELLGGMSLWDFDMTLYEARALVGGVGSLAVHPMHKKEKVARDMVVAYLRHYRSRGAPLAALYPFRPDFYGAMGFGYGTKLNGYRALPAAFRASGDKRRVRLMGPDDRDALAACYERYAARTHGMFRQLGIALGRFFASAEMRVAGYEQDGQVRGYLRYHFDLPSADNFILQDMVVRELVYETPEALDGLLSFVRSQADQVRRVVVYTQDDSFHELLDDPSNGSERLLPSVYHESNSQAVGLMYRVINLRRYFELLAEHDFGGVTITLRLTVRDTLLPEQDGDTLVRFEAGHAQVLDGADAAHADAEVRLDVNALSSLLMGCVSLRALHRLGRARVSDPALLDQIDRTLSGRDKPICMTAF
jgi:predicted acetyltransferase